MLVSEVHHHHQHNMFLGHHLYNITTGPVAALQSDRRASAATSLCSMRVAFMCCVIFLLERRQQRPKEHASPQYLQSHFNQIQAAPLPLVEEALAPRPCHQAHCMTSHLNECAVL